MYSLVASYILFIRSMLNLHYSYYNCGYTICLFTELGLLDTDTQVDEPIPELDILSAFYEKICRVLPVDELLPKLVTERVIEVNDKTRISACGKTEFERSQYLLDYFIARPLSGGDTSLFYKLLDIMSTSSKCEFLIPKMQCQLSSTMKHQKFSGKVISN